jgi:isocitrate dehydrogenase
VLKDGLAVLEGEVVDATVMRAALDAFLREQVARAKAQDVLFSVHLKATMMKVIRPDHLRPRRACLPPRGLRALRRRPRRGGPVPQQRPRRHPRRPADLPNGDEIRAAIEQGLADGPRLAMVNSDKGITNLHVPSDVIVDASMPAMIRTSGHMWGPDGAEADTLAVIPDSSYAGVYQTVIDDCRVNGAFDPTTMGSVPNVGLMAQKAEEYGSHDKTFEISGHGRVEVVDGNGTVLMSHDVAPGDIWRACQTKDAPIRDWVKLAVTRARVSDTPASSGSTTERAHDRNLIGLVEKYLGDHDTDGPRHHASLARSRPPKTLDRAHPPRRGHHLGDRQRAARLQHRPVPDPRARHVGQDAVGRPADERRWPVRDRRRRLGPQARAAARRGELPALGQPRRVPRAGRVLRAPGAQHRQRRAPVLADRRSTGHRHLLDEGKSPARRVGQIDNRGSHFWLARYWAEELAAQTEDAELAAAFADVAEALVANQDAIDAELLAVQGHRPTSAATTAPTPTRLPVMRPSATLNGIIDALA